ncbi:MAG: phosphotransferase [Candidatus Pacearchaeota archaeon]|jgi:Ser/Thr protein kinase RdoA (MazF antagonist)
MKLSKKQAQNIANLYDLGKVKSIKLIKGGWINYNFDLKTDKGRFIIRVLSYKMTKKRKFEKQEEFKLLNFINNSNFSYKTPLPIKNRNESYFSKINGRYYWVYKWIEGEHAKKNEDKNIEDVAKALAIYHKSVLNFKPKLKRETLGGLNWLVKDYKKLENINVKNKVDKLMTDNYDYFSDLLSKMLKLKFNPKPIINHADLDKSNVLLKNDKIIAFLDFDNLTYGSKLFDLSHTVKSFCHVTDRIDRKRYNLFLKSYQIQGKLTNEETKMLPYFILRECIADFWWMYLGMDKKVAKLDYYIKWNIDFVNNLVEDFKLFK